MNWAQFRTILWLRWRLSRNQFQRGGDTARVLTALVLGVAVLLAAGGGVAGLLFGATVAGPLPPPGLMLVWDGLTLAFVFFWIIGVMTELQRSESIDLARLMHLPVSLRQVFVFNYLASHLALSLIIMLPAMLGLAVGLIWGRGAWMLLLPPLVLSFLFMITAWTYCLRGWVATLMANPRRRRTIIVVMAMGMMLVGQLPNLYFQVLRSKSPSRAARGAKPEEVAAARAQRKQENERLLANLSRAHPFVPLLWLPDGAKHLAAGRPLPALLEGAACLGLGLLGLRRAYRTTVRYYQGVESPAQRVPPFDRLRAGLPAGAAEPEGRPPESAGSPPRGHLLEARLGRVPEPAAAVALATFRSLSRAPEVKMAFGMPLVVTLVLGVIFFGRLKTGVPEMAKPFVASSVAGLLWLLLFHFFSNQFGYDRQSFRTLVLSAADRRLILLGKNLAVLPLVLGMGSALLVMGAILARLPVLDTVAACFQLLTLLVLLSLTGNFVSIIAPYRVQTGSMRAGKVPVKALLLGLGATVLLPLLLAPVFVAPLAGLIWRLVGAPSYVPINLVCSMGMATVAVLAYGMALKPLGALLHARELEILEAVSSELE